MKGYVMRRWILLVVFAVIGVLIIWRTPADAHGMITKREAVVVQRNGWVSAHGGFTYSQTHARTYATITLYRRCGECKFWHVLEWPHVEHERDSDGIGIGTIQRYPYQCDTDYRVLVTGWVRSRTGMRHLFDKVADELRATCKEEG
jgi:hypothetical protein